MGQFFSRLLGNKGGAALPEKTTGTSTSTDTDSSTTINTDSSTTIVVIHSTAEWSENWQSHIQSNKLMVIDFSASWCGPCRAIEPEFKAMSTQFPGAVFLKIDVDELPTVAQQWKVEAMPTFVLVKRGQEVDRLVGANKEELRKKIQLHLSK